MYSVVRIIIGFVFLGLSIIVIKIKTIRKRILNIVFTSMLIVLIAVLSFLPFENLFVTFDSAKAAYDYYNWGKSNIELVVEGNNCDLIIDRQKDVDTYLIIPKTADGWKIGIGLDTKRVVQKVSNGITVYVHQYKNTNDYFVTIFDTNGGKATISDDYNTMFYSLEKTNAALEKTFVVYYGHISDFDSKYHIVVNGSEIVF